MNTIPELDLQKIELDLQVLSRGTIETRIETSPELFDLMNSIDFDFEYRFEGLELVEIQSEIIIHNWFQEGF